MSGTIERLRLAGVNILTSGMYGRCEPPIMYRFMMLNLIILMGTPFVMAFGVIDILRGIQPLGIIVTAVGFVCIACFVFLRRTKNHRLVSYLFVGVSFCLFLYLLAAGGSNNTGAMWFYSFPAIALFLLGFRAGNAAILAAILAAVLVLYLPGTPLLHTVYAPDFRLRFIPSLVILWAITAVFELVKVVSLKAEIRNRELHETVEELGRAREALSSEKERLAVTLRSIGDGFIATDMRGNITLMNAAAETLTGWSQEESAGRQADEVVCVVDRKLRDTCELPLRTVIAEGRVVPASGHKVLIRRDGREVIISDSGAPIRDREGHTIGAVLVFRDVTEQTRMEEDLHKAGKLESVGLLAGGIAHDFNNILAGILGYATLAKMVQSRGADGSAHLERIEQACQRATSLTNQLLTFSKGGSPVIRTMSLAALIDETVDFALSGSPHTARITVPADLWPVHADPGQIGQVLSNLLINAVQASPGESGLDVSAANLFVGEESQLPLSAGPYVMVSVQDYGAGVAPDHVDKIFDPYFTTRPGGTGLGLPVSYSIMRKHRGHIRVESNAGTGANFSIYLPASFDIPDAPPSARIPNAAPDRGSILVVDDEEDIRRILTEALGHLGHDVSAVSDGTAAVAAYRAARADGTPFDLVITDLTIPGGMGGKEIAQQLLALDPDVRIVVSSGYSNDPVMAHYGNHGFAGVIVKPYDLGTLADTITRLMRPQD